MGKARVAWQQEQVWLVQKDAALLAREQEQQQRQRLRRRVRTAPTHTPRAQGRPASAPAGGRPNQPLTAVPPSEGGVVSSPPQSLSSQAIHGSALTELLVLAGPAQSPGRPLRISADLVSPQSIPPLRCDSSFNFEHIARDVWGLF